MSLEFGIRRIPSVGTSISLCGQAVGVAIVVELLHHVPGTDSAQSLITVVSQPVVAVDGDIGQEKAIGPYLRLHAFLPADAHDSLHRITACRGLVTHDIPYHLVLRAHWMLETVSLSSLVALCGIGPAHLSPLPATVGIADPNTTGQRGGEACWTRHTNGLCPENGPRY